MRRLHVAVLLWLGYMARNVKRSNRPHERKRVGVDIRGERCRHFLIPKRPGHVTDGLQFAGRQ